jgi:hypothetical protein
LLPWDLDLSQNVKISSVLRLDVGWKLLGQFSLDDSVRTIQHYTKHVYLLSQPWIFYFSNWKHTKFGWSIACNPKLKTPKIPMNLIQGSKQKEKMESKIDIKIIKKVRNKSHIIQKSKKSCKLLPIYFDFESTKSIKKKPTMLKLHV